MKTLNEFLKEHRACTNLYEFAKDLTLEQFYLTCPRGDWLVWLFKQLQPTKKNELRLAAAHCANTVRHLMTDKRSTDVIDWIINNNGEKPPLKLIKDAAAAAANSYAAYTAYASAADTANAADTAAAAAAYAAAATGYSYTAIGYTYADADTDTDDAAAREENQRQTAKICREILPLPMWGEVE